MGRQEKTNVNPVGEIRVKKPRTYNITAGKTVVDLRTEDTKMTVGGRGAEGVARIRRAEFWYTYVLMVYGCMPRCMVSRYARTQWYIYLGGVELKLANGTSVHLAFHHHQAG